MERIVICVGLILFLNALFSKWGVWSKISFLGANQRNSKFLYNLSQCRFCLLFWLSCFVVAIYCAVTAFSFSDLALPFVISGFLTLKRNDDF